MKQSEHFDSFYPEFKKKSKKIMKDYTLPTSTLLQQKNNVEIIDVWKKKFIHSFFPNFINVVKRG